MADYSNESSTAEMTPVRSRNRNPLQDIKSHWQKSLVKAIDYKRKHFDEDAKEALLFFNGGKDLLKHLYGDNGSTKKSDLWVNGAEGFPKPDMCLTTNRVCEMVELFGPAMYAKNPHRQVNPRQLPQIPMDAFGDQNDPQAQQAMQFAQFMDQQVMQSNRADSARATLLQYYLNYTPTPLGLKKQMRKTIDETIICGLSIMATETYRPHGSNIQMVGSFHDSVDNHVIDPDMETIEDALVWYRRKCEPLWKVERRLKEQYGIQRPRGWLKGNASSTNQDAAKGTYGIDEYMTQKGVTNDLLVYWEVYSKMGLGGRLEGVPAELRRQTAAFGDNIFLLICDTCPIPMNLIEAEEGDQMQERMRWPTPFWADDSWPFTAYYFHENRRCVYPFSHVKPAMGELKFLNWAYSFVAGKIKNTCKDYIAILKQAGEELKQRLLNGGDLTVLELSMADGGRTIGDVVQFLQMPQMNGDIWKVIEAIEEQFKRRTGLDELMFGATPHQFRSAAEANLKGTAIQVRPDDMADKIEDGATEMARREAFAARIHLEPQRDIAPVMGMPGAYYWEQFVTPATVEEMLHQLEYRIEAGSIRKPEKNRDIDNVNQAVQVWGPMLQQWASGTMDVAPLNALMDKWGKAFDEDVTEMHLTPPPPPDPNQPTPEQQAAQVEQQAAEQEMQLKQLDAEIRMQEAQVDLQMKQADAAMDQQSAQQELIQDQMAFQQEMRQMVAKHALEMQSLKDKMVLAKQQAKQQATQKAKAKPAAKAK